MSARDGREKGETVAASHIGYTLHFIAGLNGPANKSETNNYDHRTHWIEFDTELQHYGNHDDDGDGEV